MKTDETSTIQPTVEQPCQNQEATKDEFKLPRMCKSQGSPVVSTDDSSSESSEDILSMSHDSDVDTDDGFLCLDLTDASPKRLQVTNEIRMETSPVRPNELPTRPAKKHLG